MAVYLNELQAGCDRELVGFPHLLVCMGVVLETGAWMYGFHFDELKDTPVSAAYFASFITTRGGNPANGVRLYGCANWTARYGDNGRREAWKTEMRVIAGALGYQGKVSGFNTAIIDPQDGTYVEYIPEYPQRRCRIYYKRNEKVNFGGGFTPGGQSRTLSAFRPDAFGSVAPVSPKSGIVLTTGATVQRTDSNKGNLHELNYFQRLVSFDV